MKYTEAVEAKNMQDMELLVLHNVGIQ